MDFAYPLPRAATLGDSYEIAAQQLLSNVLGFHYYAISFAGGTEGIRDEGLLISAVYRPFVLFDDAPAYSTPLEQASVLLESLVINHPFLDGNKRTGMLACLYFLERSGYWRDVALLTSKERTQLEDLVLRLAKGEYRSKDVEASLHRILGPTRNRRARPSRLLSGAFFRVREVLTPRN